MARDLRRERLLLILASGTGLLPPRSAGAFDVLASVRLRGGTITDTTVGGADQVTADRADVASVTGPCHTQTSGGS